MKKQLQKSNYKKAMEKFDAAQKKHAQVRSKLREAELVMDKAYDALMQEQLKTTK